jgi:hypothetical protein
VCRDMSAYSCMQASVQAKFTQFWTQAIAMKDAGVLPPFPSPPPPPQPLCPHPHPLQYHNGKHVRDLSKLNRDLGQVLFISGELRPQTCTG